MIKIGLVGHSGRMGAQIQNLISESPDMELTGIWDSKGLRLIKNEQEEWDASEVDVVIDFSMPQNFEAVVKWCQNNEVPLVSGITGLDKNQILQKTKDLGFKSLKAPFFWSSNMSLGIATLRHMLKSLSLFKKAEFKITETHHIHKKDKPSGTAITLKQDLEEVVGVKQIQIEALREGEVFGVHEVRLQTPMEEICLKHTALDRKVFAQGSLEVVRWILNRRIDFYEMGDFLQDVTKP